MNFRHNLPPWLRAFTLIELLVVIVVVTVLATLSVSVARGALDRSRVAVCTNNLRQLGAGMMLYMGDHDGQLPFGPKASAFGMSGNLYTSTGAPTSLITLQDGRVVALGLVLPYLKDPKCFFCPGSDQSVDAGRELANYGKKQVQSSYYYRHAGNTNITDIGGTAFSAPRVAGLGENRRGEPIRALIMDTQFLCAEGLRNFGAVPRSHHRRQSTNVYFIDGHVTTFVDRDDRLTVDITGGSNAHQSFNLILQKFEMVDDGSLDGHDD